MELSDGEGRRRENCGLWEEAVVGVWGEGESYWANLFDVVDCLKEHEGVRLRVVGVR